MAAPSPVTEKTDLVSFDILSNGSPIDDTYEVKSILVRYDVNRIPTAKLTLYDGVPALEDFKISDSSTFVPGTEIEVKAGYNSDNSTIFKGIVVQQGLKVRGGTPSVIEVECQDKAVKMTVGRKNAYYTNSKDSDVISKAISDAGLTPDVESTSVELKEVVQYYATDWDFALSRAEINGLIVAVNDGTVSVKKPDTSSSPVLTVTYGDDILEFDAEMDARTQLSSVKSNAWDFSSQELVNAEGSDQSLTLPGNISNSTLAGVLDVSDFDLQSTAPIEQSQLEVWAKAKMLKSQLSKIRGKVSFQGSSLVGLGKTITLAGLGERFNGTGFISGFEHDISNGNWVTQVTLGLNYEWFQQEFDINSPPASGLLPAITGLQNGTVKQINEDPDGQLRVLVNVPIISADGDGIWARLSNLYATNKAGTFFYPEVGDEVVLGFLNEDPRYPVILGSLYSNDKKAAPYTPDEQNSTKAIVTNSQLKITFDDEKKVLELETPGGNTMTFSDEDEGITIKDQNGNSIKMSSSGIEIESMAAMTLKATSSMTLTGPEGITGSSDASVSVSGLSVSVSGESELSLSGASTSMSGETMVSISGAMVNIN